MLEQSLGSFILLVSFLQVIFLLSNVTWLYLEERFNTK